MLLECAYGPRRASTVILALQCPQFVLCPPSAGCMTLTCIVYFIFTGYLALSTFNVLSHKKKQSGGIAIDPELQDNILLPKGFTEYIYHVGNVSEVHSIITSGLILGGQSLKRGRQSVFFTIAYPMED